MILVDIDNQIEFLLSARALYVSGAERLIPVFARIFEHAEQRGIPVISSVDAHTENDPEFNDWPPHCVAGTLGQQKIAATLLKQRATISSRSEARWPRDVQQMIVEKQTLDAFSNPNFSG